MAQTKIAGLFLDPTVISGLTAITDGASDADYLFVWDAGTSTLKKILPDNLGLLAGPTFTGTTTFATLSDGTIAVTAWVDEDNMSSNSATLIPTQQSVKAYVDANGGTAVAGTTDNGILTFVNSGSTFAAEANLTFDGSDLLFQRSNSNGYNQIKVRNTSDTSGSTARINVASGGASAGDAYVFAEIIGQTNWSWGIDNSASDSWVLSKDWQLGTSNDYLRVGTSGDVTMPKTPCFAAYNSSADADVTGNNGAATVDYDTEIFDQGDNFANDTFTAPVTGRYLITASVRIDGVTASSRISNCEFISSNRQWGSYMQLGADPAVSPAGNRNVAIIDMDINDKLTVVLTNGGESGNVHDIGGGATHPTTYITGKLVA